MKAAILTGLLGGALFAPALAQDVGSRLPSDVSLVNFQNTRAADFADFQGRPVLLEFFAHWCAPCAASVPHVNGLYEEFGDEGFVVIGVTKDKEPVPETEAFAKRTKMGYPYAYDERGELNAFLGIRSIPHAVLLSPQGEILWRGHPMQLEEQAIEKSLSGSWPSDVLEALDGMEYAAALAAAEKAEGGASIQEAIRARIGTHLERLRAFQSDGDYLALLERGAALEEGLDGLPQQAEATALLEAVRKDEKAQAIAEAQERVRTLTAGGVKKSQRRAVESELAKIVNELPDTAAARDAERALEQIRS